MKKKIIYLAVTLVTAGAIFFGGMKYGESKSSLGNFSAGDFQNMAGGRLQGNASSTAGRVQGGFLSGEIISKDEQSITIKAIDGSSKIVFFSSSTSISKTTEGTATDLNVGEQIMASGEQNPDGSYTAKTIQLGQKAQMLAN